MVASWVRKDFAGAVGVTQHPPGPHLKAVQDHFQGHALLCIDVSWSMEGRRLAAAVAGAHDFLKEAAEAHYRCGLVLWNSDVVTHLPTTSDPSTVNNALQVAEAGGGTALAPTLRAALEELAPMGGDRVVCVFSDGAIDDAEEAQHLATEARSRGIRFVVRALGRGAGRSLVNVLWPGQDDAAAQTIADVRGVRRGIASMVADLRKEP